MSEESQPASNVLPADLLEAIGARLSAEDLCTARLLDRNWHAHVSARRAHFDPPVEVDLLGDSQHWDSKLAALNSALPSLQECQVYISSRIPPASVEEAIGQLSQLTSLCHLELRFIMPMRPHLGAPQPQVPPSLSLLTRLSTLFLVMGTLPQPAALGALSSLTALSNLKLLSGHDGYGLRAAHLSALGTLQSLRCLEAELEDDSDQVEILQCLQAMSDLQELCLHSFSLFSRPPDIRQFLSSMSHLTTVSLDLFMPLAGLPYIAHQPPPLPDSHVEPGSNELPPPGAPGRPFLRLNIASDEDDDVEVDHIWEPEWGQPSEQGCIALLAQLQSISLCWPFALPSWRTSPWLNALLQDPPKLAAVLPSLKSFALQGAQYEPREQQDILAVCDGLRGILGNLTSLQLCHSTPDVEQMLVSATQLRRLCLEPNLPYIQWIGMQEKRQPILNISTLPTSLTALDLTTYTLGRAEEPHMENASGLASTNAALPLLEDLVLSMCNIKGLNEVVSNCGALRALELREVKAEVTAGDCLSQLRRLTALRVVGGDVVTGEELKGLSAVRGLRQLAWLVPSLGQPVFDGRMLQMVGQLSRLYVLRTLPHPAGSDEDVMDTIGQLQFCDLDQTIAW